MIRVIVVDDHPIFRRGLIALLRAHDIEVVGEAGNGLEALEIVTAESPDVVLMDISMPDLGGIEATERLLALDPAARVVVITLHDDEATVARALAAGASAYVTKQSSPEQILAAVQAAADGALWLGPGVPRPLPSRPQPVQETTTALPGLTPRESVIADLVSRGLPNPVIAERLHLSVKTVANYVSIIALKLGADDRASLAQQVRAARS
ncbi:DNA-binding NarL/FixJ family response regulator [Microbacterium terrae]|uniref:Transcriptional regulatory protein DegU n=1 Tax=Microbacterium terrae TaxID=69369 RepID=A0A0M2GXP2_9MICO|nr:response regulator transcription factor [Microbacterium terrae]KJL38739.1 Transcriptional regulatory protein DegU [Microbacterium terrae]MBP1076158.1 DNA-binding NarL/FixJ family response regulator [Microbacterium terrae]GLJ96978.1 DNA-binding response regulator [Microbacterium terrae]